MGGDKFCAIVNQSDERAFEESCRQFETLLDKETIVANAEYPLSVAYGYAVTGAVGVDEWFKKEEYKRKRINI